MEEGVSRGASLIWLAFGQPHMGALGLSIAGREGFVMYLWLICLEAQFTLPINKLVNKVVLLQTKLLCVCLFSIYGGKWLAVTATVHGFITQKGEKNGEDSSCISHDPYICESLETQIQTYLALLRVFSSDIHDTTAEYIS